MSDAPKQSFDADSVLLIGKHCIQTFREAVQKSLDKKNYNVFVYHGIAGIGKTSLKKSFKVS